MAPTPCTTMTRRTPLALLALCLPLTALAQPAEPPTVYAVPFASTGNAVELELGAPDGVELGGVEVVVTATPSWLRFHATAVAAEVPEGDAGAPVARLAFDVDRAAPVGEPVDVRFEVRAGGGVVATHAVRLEIGAPAVLALDLPRPNPARGAVVVPFSVPVAGPVRLVVYDALGREVAVLADGAREPGAYDARVEAGSLASGVYVVRLVAGAEARVRRLTVVR